jgi:hypothetical protein
MGRRASLGALTARAWRATYCVRGDVAFAGPASRFRYKPEPIQSGTRFNVCPWRFGCPACRRRFVDDYRNSTAPMSQRGVRR